MKSLIIALFAAFLGAEVCAQNCYQCLSITTDGEGLDLPETMTGFSSCNGQLETVDCSAAGGCLKADYNFQYDVQGSGRVGANILVRTCGAAVDYCLSGSEFQQALDLQRDTINAMLPSNVAFVSGSGDSCICDSNLCNGSPVWMGSFAVLLLSLLFSYVATKW